MTDGSVSGAISTTDSLGRGGFLSAEKKIMELSLDFEGKTGGTRKRPNVGT